MKLLKRKLEVAESKLKSNNNEVIPSGIVSYNNQKEFINKIKTHVERFSKGEISYLPPIWNTPQDPAERNDAHLSSWFIKKVVLWIPELRFKRDFRNKRPYCPCCEKDDKVVSHGWKCNRCSTKISIRRSNASDEDVDTDSSADEEGNENLRGTFRCWDEDVLNSFPAHVKKSFPFIITNDLAVEASILDRLVTSCLSGGGFQPEENLYKERHKKHFMEQQLRYYSWCLERERDYKDKVTNRIPGFSLENLPVVESFGNWDTKDGWNGSCFSDNYLRELLVNSFKQPFTKSTINGIEKDITKEDYYCLSQQHMSGVAGMCPLNLLLLLFKNFYLLL